MPLTATVNGDPVVATNVRPNDWAAYRGRKPWPVLSCGRDGYAKTSKLGTQFFQHAADCDTAHKGESADHLRVKAAIITIATALGWDARAEVPADNRSWIADVLVERDGRRIAFEVQLSGQVEGGYRHRQQRYAAEGIECYWLTRRSKPTDLRGVPALNIRIDDTDITVADKRLTADRRPLETFITEVLTGDLRWAAETDAPQDAAVRWGMHRCTECDQYSVAWDADEYGTIHCARCLRTQDGYAINGTGEPRRSKAARGVTAPSALPRAGRFGEREFHCPACHNVLPTLTGAGSDYVLDVATLPPAPHRAHWCAPEGALTGAADVISYLDGTRHSPEAVPADHRTNIELTASADRRYRVATAAAALRQEQALAAARSKQWLADQLAQQVRRLEADSARRGDTTTTTHFLDQLRQRAQQATLEAHLAESGKTSPNVPTPPWWGPPPGNAHERTAAIDAYTQKHLRHIDDLVALFPPLTPECVCHPCRLIHNEFDRHQRQMLWPDRSRGRNLHPAAAAHT